MPDCRCLWSRSYNSTEKLQVVDGPSYTTILAIFNIRTLATAAGDLGRQWQIDNDAHSSEFEQTEHPTTGKNPLK
jgi:hypothetical protein